MTDKEFTQHAIAAALSARVETGNPGGLTWSLTQAKDWTGTCSRCGEKLKGTIQQIKEHSCGRKG